MPSKAHNLFLQYKRQLIHELGPKGLADDEINKIGKREFGVHWGGAVASDRVKLQPNHYYIVNTSGHSGRGIHWLALYTTKSSAYIWDSYDRSVKRLVPSLVKAIGKHGYHLHDTEHRPDQVGFTSQVCGDDSLAFLLVVRDLGIRAARHV